MGRGTARAGFLALFATCLAALSGHASAQPITVEVTSVDFFIGGIDRTIREGREAFQEGDCEGFGDAQSTLQFYSGERFANLLNK